MESKTSYRKEIDGLRAIAVFSVILFHAGFSQLSGGFLGVDIFFVISGYLITSILITEIHAGDFSILRFYERRARRILPALFLVMLVAMPFAWLWLIPADMLDFAQSYSAITIFSSNLLFWKESGYFDTAAELKPMLHTWSLAVEEQFYVVFPVLLLGLWRFGVKACFAVVAVITLMSLLLAQWATTHATSAGFYLLPFRWWELAFGSLTAFLMRQHIGAGLSSGHKQLLSYVGLVLIVISLVLFDKYMPMPGFYSLAPVLGTCLIILFCTPDAPLTKLLGCRLFVALGLISYSAYLWHQPVFVLLHHRLNGDFSLAVKVALILLTFILAYISWRFVEQPFRNKKWIGRNAIFILALCFSVFMMLFGVVGHITKGYTSRFENVLDSNITSFPRIDNGWCFYSVDTIASLEVGAAGQRCLLGSKGAERKALLYGDSFAGQYEPFWHKLGLENHIEVNAVTTNWCFPGKGDGFSGPVSSSAYQQCQANRRYLTEQATAYQLVILGGDWASVSSGNHLAEVKALIQWLSGQVEWVVIMPSPKLYDKNINSLYVRSVLLNQHYDISDVTADSDKVAISAHNEIFQFINTLDNVIMIDRDVLFKGLDMKDGIPFSSDGRHLSVYGSEAAFGNFSSSIEGQNIIELLRD